MLCFAPTSRVSPRHLPKHAQSIATPAAGAGASGAAGPATGKMSPGGLTPSKTCSSETASRTAWNGESASSCEEPT